MGIKESELGDSTQSSISDSLSLRYVYKVGTAFIRMAVGLVTNVVVPRSLGPSAFGDLSFLKNFFQNTIVLIDTGTSDCFYTKVCQRSKEWTLVTFYSLFAISLFGLVSLFILLTHLVSWESRLWPSQQLKFIYMAAIWAFLNWINSVVEKVADAFGLTVMAERVKIRTQIVSICVILALYFLKLLHLTSVFLYFYFVLLLSSLQIVAILVRIVFSKMERVGLSLKAIKKYLVEFFAFVHPLFVHSFISIVVALYERWLLQVHGGSVQQGFYGLGYQMSVISILCTAAFVPLVMREFAIAHKVKDKARMRYFVLDLFPIFYLFPAFLASFFALHAKDLVFFFGGRAFEGAELPVALMAFYPVHQSYNQLYGAALYATEQTRLYRNTSVFFHLLSVPLLFFLISPSHSFGLGLGAVGLSLKMLTIQFLILNARMFYFLKTIGVSFWKLFLQELYSLALIFLMAYGIKVGIEDMFLAQLSSVVRFFIAALVYSSIAVTILYVFPRLLGVKREVLRTAIAGLVRKKE